MAQQTWNDKFKDLWDDYRGWIVGVGLFAIYSIATKDRAPKNITKDSSN